MKIRLLLLISLFCITFSLETKAAEAYAVLDGNTLTFYYDNLKSSRTGTKYALNTNQNKPGWYSNRTSVYTVIFDASFSEARPTTTSHWFDEMKNMTQIVDIKYLNTSNDRFMDCMFNKCFNLKNLDLSHFDTSNVIQMDCMFTYCEKLEYLDVSNFDTSKIKRMYYMFAYCDSLKSLDVSSFNTSNVTDMEYTFGFCKSLKKLDLRNFDTSNVTTMSYMFGNCESLTFLDVSSFNTSKVTNMYCMFNGCSSLTNLDVSNFDTSNVTSMSYMFCRCRKLHYIDISHFNTSKVEYMHYMFSSCDVMEALDVSNFDTSSLVKTGKRGCVGMFYNSSNLKKLFVSSTMSDISDNACEGVGTAAMPCTIYAPDGFKFGVSTTGSYFQWKNGYFKLGTIEAPKEAYAILYDDIFGNGKNLHFYYDSEKSSHEGTVYSLNEGASFPGWNTEETASSVSVVGFHCDFQDARPTSGYCWFYEMGNLERMDDGQFLNTSEMTDMAGMFFYCSKLDYIGTQGFDTSKATNMWAMFYGCSALEELDVSGFNTSHVTDMTGMFCYCSSLASLDVSNFDTSKSTSFNGMFYGCSSLTSLDLGNFDISNATDTRLMLAYCTGLKELTVSLSMQDLADGACAGIGTASSPCTIYAPVGFNFGVSTTGSYFQWKGGYFKLGSQTALLGDVNASGSVTLADAICEISWLLEQNPPVFVEAVADYNQDNVVSASDAIAIIQYVVTANTNVINPDVPDEDVAKLLEEMGLLRPASNGFDLTLGDLNDYTAFTADITLDDDATLLSASLSTHSVATHSLGDGRYRIVAWSMDMAPIGAGAILHCETTGVKTSAVTLDNIRIVDMNTREHAAPSVECTPTGIREIETGASPLVRYRIDGTRVSSPQRGIYIEDGRKVLR